MGPPLTVGSAAAFSALIIIIIIIMTTTTTAIEFSLGGSSPYTSTDKTYIHINETTQKYSKNNKKHSKYKYTYYQNTHTLQNPHIH
jgi:uncharacterized protein YxeA